MLFLCGVELCVRFQRFKSRPETVATLADVARLAAVEQRAAPGLIVVLPQTPIFQPFISL